MDAHHYRPGGREEDLRLPKGQGTLTALKPREGEVGGERGRQKGSGEEVEIFNK